MSTTPTSAADSNLPAKQSSEAQEIIARLLSAGHKPHEIARMMEPDDKKARRKWRLRIWNMVRNEQGKMAELIAQNANIEMMLGLGPATSALTRRAAKGRPDAIKLLFEASGFHNPKVKHEHSGDIKITMDMPRPKKHSTIDLEDENIVDAEVVDD